MKKKYTYILAACISASLLSWKACKSGSLNNLASRPNEYQPDVGGASEDPKKATKTERDSNPGYREKIREFYEHADAEVDFYGRVIDQNGKGVAGANVHFQTERSGLLMADGRLANNNEKGTAVSAADGTFSIQGAHGLTLRIEKVEKEGYRDGGQTARSFGYRGTPDLHSPDPKTPVEFLVVSNDSPGTQVAGRYQMKFAWNQGPVDFLIPNVGKLTILPTRKREAGQIRNFDWHAVVSMEGADLAKMDKGQAKIAPEDGYRKSFEYGAEQGNKTWGSAIHERYAFKTTGGLYGVINLDLVVRWEDGEQQGSLEVRINESGSRNLD